MGLLLNLVTLPVSGPLRATTWIAQQVLEIAERQYYDETAIRQEISDVETRHQIGELSDAEHEVALDALVERLMAARAYREMHDRNPNG